MDERKAFNTKSLLTTLTTLHCPATLWRSSHLRPFHPHPFSQKSFFFHLFIPVRTIVLSFFLYSTHISPPKTLSLYNLIVILRFLPSSLSLTSSLLSRSSFSSFTTRSHCFFLLGPPNTHRPLGMALPLLSSPPCWVSTPLWSSISTTLIFTPHSINHWSISF